MLLHSSWCIMWLWQTNGCDIIVSIRKPLDSILPNSMILFVTTTSINSIIWLYDNGYNRYYFSIQVPLRFCKLNNVVNLIVDDYIYEFYVVMANGCDSIASIREPLDWILPAKQCESNCWPIHSQILIWLWQMDGTRLSPSRPCTNSYKYNTDWPLLGKNYTS